MFARVLLGAAVALSLSSLACSAEAFCDGNTHIVIWQPAAHMRNDMVTFYERALLSLLNDQTLAGPFTTIIIRPSGESLDRHPTECLHVLPSTAASANQQARFGESALDVAVKRAQAARKWARAVADEAATRTEIFKRLTASLTDVPGDNQSVDIARVLAIAIHDGCNTSRPCVLHVFSTMLDERARRAIAPGAHPDEMGRDTAGYALEGVNPIDHQAVIYVNIVGFLRDPRTWLFLDEAASKALRIYWDNALPNIAPGAISRDRILFGSMS